MANTNWDVDKGCNPVTEVNHSAPDHRCTECFLRGELRRDAARLQLLERENSRLEALLATARHALAVSEFNRLTLVIARAVATGNRAMWERAVADRMALGVTEEEAMGLIGKVAA